MQDKEKEKILTKLASKVIGDRQLLQMLSDQVYELMLEEFRLKKERNK